MKNLNEKHLKIMEALKVIEDTVQQHLDKEQDAQAGATINGAICLVSAVCEAYTLLDALNNKEDESKAM